MFVCQSARDHRCLSANRRRIIGVYPPIAERSSAFIRPSARDCPCLSANRQGYPHFCPLIATDNPILPACCRRCSGSGGQSFRFIWFRPPVCKLILLFFLAYRLGCPIPATDCCRASGTRRLLWFIRLHPRSLRTSRFDRRIRRPRKHGLPGAPDSPPELPSLRWNPILKDKRTRGYRLNREM